VRRNRHVILIALVVYALGLAYLSLAYSGRWACTETPLFGPRLLSYPRADILANVVAYVPFGAMLAYAAATATDRGWLRSIGVALALGTALSLGLEVTQACLPGRTSSWADVAANAAGVAAGALLAGVWRRVVRDAGGAGPLGMLADPPVGPLALAALLVWLAHQTFPWSLSIRLETFRENVAYVEPLLAGAPALDPMTLARHSAIWMCGGLLLRAVSRPGTPVAMAMLLLAVLTVGVQLFLELPRLSAESLLGIALALPLLLVVDRRAPLALQPYLLLITTLMLTAVHQLQPGGHGFYYRFSWLPVFGGGSPLNALQTGLFFFACALAYATAAAWMRPERPRWMTLAVLTVAWQFLLELAQIRVPGRVPDTSTPLLLAAGWAIALVLVSTTAARRSAATSPASRPAPRTG
jgi:VanZ family protein